MKTNSGVRLEVVCVTALFFSLLAGAGRATTYYVDSVAGAESNNGTSAATPWQSLAANSKINTTTFLPGDSILFKRGSSWTGTFHILGNGSIAAPLVVDAYGTGAAPVISGGGAAYAIYGYNKQYLTIQNLDISNDSTTAGNRDGIRLEYGSAGFYSGVKILNNDIHNVRARTDTSLNAYSNAAIYIKINDNSVGAQLDSFLIQGNDIHDTRCAGIYQKAPAYYGGNPQFWATNLVIRDNVLDQTGADHISINGAKAPLIEYNAGYDCGVNSEGYAFMAGMWSAYFCQDALFQYNEVARMRNPASPVDGDCQAFDVDLGAVGTNIFQYNYTHDNAGGILIMMPESLAKTVIYRYNLSVDDDRRTNSGSQWPMYPVAGVNSAYVYNNVFYTTLTSGYKIKDSPVNFYNNIFVAPAAIYPGKPVFSNNCYFGHTADVNDPYKVVADPKFVGPLPATSGADGYTSATTGVFKLQANSPCINWGKSITAPVGNGGLDFWGNPLYAGGSADIGAHEVVGGSNLPPSAVIFTDDAPSASVVYTGTSWTHTSDPLFYNSTRSDAITVGDSVQFGFTGTNMSIFGRKGPALGKISVSVDGGPAVTIDCYWAIDLWHKELFRASNLNYGAHTVRMTVALKNSSSTYNRIVLDYFQQMPGDLASLPLSTPFDLPANGTYTGTWSYTPSDYTKFYGGTRAASSTVGDSVSFTFTGNGVRLYGSQASTLGKLSITIDGGPATLVNCFGPGLSINFDYLTKLYEINGLSSGSHTLVATVATKDPLSSGNGVSLDLFEVLTGGPPNDVIMDNTDTTGVTITGAWSSSNGVAGYYGLDDIYDGNTGKGSKSVRFTPDLLTAGNYEVFARWPTNANRATNVPIDIISASGTATVSVNQQLNNGLWVSLGTYTFNAGKGGSVLIRNGGTNGQVIVDAVRFLKR